MHPLAPHFLPFQFNHPHSLVGLIEVKSDFSIRTVVITVLSLSFFKFPDASHFPLPLEKQAVDFMGWLTETWPSAMLLPMLAPLEHASYFTYSVPGLFPNHSQKSVNSGVMTVKKTEPSWIWKSREQVTTTFHQFDLCSFNALHFLQVTAFLLRTLMPGPSAHPSWDLAAGAQGQLSPILADDEPGHLGSTLTAV